MSHNVTVSDVKINDIDALQMAVAELQKEGTKISLAKDSHYRGYNTRESGVYPYVLKLEGSPYDIALTKNQDGSYSPVFDPWGGHIRANVGASGSGIGVDGKACNINSPQANIGRLMQRYAVCKAEKEAHRQGLTTNRQFNNKTQQYQLEVVGY